jgi:hypothetical protein
MRIALILGILFFHVIVHSQNGWNAYLSSNPTVSVTGFCNPIVIDKYGNKYVGSTNSTISSSSAFAKYNVVSGFWTHYCQNNTPVLPSNRVQALAADTAGNVWLGTPAGLVKYDGSIFTVFTTSNGLPDNNVLSIHCVNDQVYIGTMGGLTRYDGALFHDYNLNNGLLCADTIYSIQSETPTKLWLGHKSGIIEFNINSSFTSSSYNYHPFPWTTTKVNCIYIDNFNKKWLGTYGKGVVEFDNVNFSLASVTYSNVLGAGLPSVCFDIAKGPNNGPVFLAQCQAYTTPPSILNSNYCLLELLPNKDYKTYYPPNGNYSIGDYLENDASGEIFLTNRSVPFTGGVLKFMFSFKPWQYNPFMLGPGGNVNSKNLKFLDVNRVKASISNRGDKHWDIAGTGTLTSAGYEVPKGSGRHANFCSTLWIGGLDPSNQLHLAAQMYRNAGANDFWPGPLDTISATTDSMTFNRYDKVWKVDYNDINTFITQFNLGNVPNTYTPTADILSWPADGSGNYSRNLAPFVDVNNNGIYDPLIGGDYPKIKGDQCVYSIFNDAFDVHSESKGLPLGVEVHAMAYAYGCPNFINGKNELAYTTFYHYKIINRSNTNYHDTKLVTYNDADLGYWNDDNIACRVQDNLCFTYNSDTNDENAGGQLGYTNYPPAAGTTILKGPPAPLNDGIDNNNNGIADEVNEECLMNKFAYYDNNFSTPSASPRWRPATTYQFHNYMSGRWRDSTDLTCGGNGYGGTIKTDFAYPWSFYPGMPCSLWGDNFNPKGDRRTIVSIGPFDFNAKESVEMEFAYVWSCDSSATGQNIGSANKLITDVQKVRAFYYSNIPTTCLPNPAIGMSEQTTLNSNLILYPNPAGSTLYLKNKSAFEGLTEISIHNTLGQILYKNSIEDLNNRPIDISFLYPGVYFITLRFNSETSTKKFIKE